MTSTYHLRDLVQCSDCKHPMLPNLSTQTEEGTGWSCLTRGCPQYTADEIEAEDLVACGVPEWVANRLVILIGELTEELGE